MTLVKFNQPAKTFHGLVDELLNGKFLNKDFATSDFFGASYAPVNISETKDGYSLEVVAPGFAKDDFKVKIDGPTLTISAEKKTESKDENEKHLRREFSFRSFSRSFTLDEKVEAAKINAKYENGVLHLTLPKKEAAQETVKEIIVA
ncbi:Hsp20/alpha crystallin family protein [Chitinophaga sp.]|mgnify:CR=1 FL=1|uniref:Hsp20/alpha crystallin family protein n=1 Tax=Chitinophaga sp. TaxID=1869181 RepID=UPI002611F366|nr:Hsp20/alpha crystallin family protein [uncultured Chitinophaga sp.]